MDESILARASVVNGTELDPERSCYRKHRFGDEKLAQKKANLYGLEHYFCDVCGGFHLTKKAMAAAVATVDLKKFLREHGFTFKDEGDRGTYWGNGSTRIFVQTTYDGEPSKLRAVMDQIREAHRRKEALAKAERMKEEQLQKKLAAQTGPARPAPAWAQVETPEQHRERQIAEAKAMKDKEPQEPATPPPATPADPEVDNEKKPAFKKFSGEERLYVFGRIRAMLDAKMQNEAIARALIAEGVKLPNGSLPNADYIGQIRWNWTQKPERAKKYALILMPRVRSALAPALEAPARPVVVAPPRPAPEPEPKVQRTRFGLPLSVDKVLADPDVSEDERLQILLVFVELPPSATQVMADEKISLKQKIAVVEALGIRRGNGVKNEG